MAIVIVSEKGGLSAVSLNPRLFKPAISAYVREPDLFIYLLFNSLVNQTRRGGIKMNHRVYLKKEKKYWNSFIFKV